VALDPGAVAGAEEGDGAHDSCEEELNRSIGKMTISGVLFSDWELLRGAARSTHRIA
jgi:hypothetical protein